MTRWALAASVVLVSSLVGRAGSQESDRPQEPTPTFPAAVEQVTVDVVVADRKGQPITGLKQEDLEVYEDGVRQAIASFDAVQVSADAAEAPPAAPRVSTNAAAKEERRGRSFAIVFDDVHLTAYTARQAKGAVAEFLTKETREGDRVTLVAASGGAWWATRMLAGREELLGIVKRLEGRLQPETTRDRLSDYEAMRIHVFRDNAVLNRVQRRFETYGLATVTQQSKHVRDLVAVEDPYVTSRAAEVYYTATARNRVTLEAVERALNALIEIRGRKSLVLVSEGFIYDPELDVFKRIVSASRRANTAIYFVNGRGLEGLPFGMDAELSTTLPQEDIGFAFSEAAETTEGSESLAADTGGFTVRNTNDLAGGLKRIADETRAYYLIGYNPKNAARDGAFRKIQVKVPGRKGIQIRARKGYYAPSDHPAVAEAKPGLEPVFQRALDSPYERDDIPLRMTDFVREETLHDKARVYVATEVDIRGLGFEEKDGRALGTLQLLLVAMHRETGEFFRYDQKMELALPAETRELVSRNWLPVVRDFELAPGRYRAKIVVQDKATGKVGTVAHDFEVPDLTRFRVSTPVLSDLRESTSEGGRGEQIALMARRDFSQGTSLYCQFDVYGATRLEDSGMPRVSMGYEVRRSDGTLLTGDAPSFITPTPLGALSRVIGFSLDAATPGDYELLMRVKDELSGKTLELHEPFSVSARLAATPPAPTGK
jgi:VWFA-related protein